MNDEHHGSPSPEKVRKIREEIQQRLGISKTDAMIECGAMLHTDRRTWMRWETGERKMHAAFFELAELKSTLID